MSQRPAQLPGLTPVKSITRHRGNTKKKKGENQKSNPLRPSGLEANINKIMAVNTAHQTGAINNTLTAYTKRL